MKLEQEIKQTKPFLDEFQKLEVNLTFTFHWLMARVSKNLSESDITPQQYNVLRILRGQHPHPTSVMMLKERMLDRECDASRLVDRLVQKGFVTRNICPKDRRKVDVLISKEGLELLKIFDNQESIIKTCQTLSEAEAKKANILLDKLRG